ncbi:DoxX family protein [Micropruina sp.]|uniref:DoxX family protein n=1 Tax=Micropruina sp. TaxID=2737536 RepID=UPI0039E58AA6
MSLLRFAARTMLASFFVMSGVKTLRDPASLVPATEPIAKTFLPLAEKTLPPQAAAYLPEDAKGLVKLTALAQIVGGVSLATGIGRRTGAAVLAVSMLPQLIASAPFGPSGDREGSGDFLRDVALTGGVLLASGDTEGQPNLAYRAKTRAEALSREAEHTKAAVAREAARTKKSLQREGKKAARQAKKFASKATKTVEGALT